VAVSTPTERSAVTVDEITDPLPPDRRGLDESQQCLLQAPESDMICTRVREHLGPHIAFLLFPSDYVSIGKVWS
jgi:hypothetical protein